jgi:hypothetical protein
MSFYKYDYAIGGESCQTNMDVLVDNKKFLSPNDMVYNLLYTRMQRYPLYNMWTDKTNDKIDNKKDDKGDDKKDDTQEEDSEIPQNTNETYSRSFGCCGRR